MVGVIDGFRWAIGGDAEPLYWPGLAVSAVRHRRFSLAGRLVFPQDRANLRGRDLTDPARGMLPMDGDLIITVENLGKKLRTWRRAQRRALYRRCAM